MGLRTGQDHVKLKARPPAGDMASPGDHHDGRAGKVTGGF